MDDDYENNSVDELLLADLPPKDLGLEQKNIRMSGGLVKGST